MFPQSCDCHFGFLQTILQKKASHLASQTLVRFNSFDPSHMPYLSQAERDYITEGVQSDLRADGRGRLDYRALVLETGIISQANGSARVRLGDGTDVLVGVKVEIDQVEPDADNVGKVVCNVEW
jgi:exosome complex RNA-binding protein Rrp42 (RNase PH superfamily)